MKNRNPGIISKIYFETIEYPCLRNLFLSTAFLQIFFDTEKAKQLGFDSFIEEAYIKR